MTRCFACESFLPCMRVHRAFARGILGSLSAEYQVARCGDHHRLSISESIRVCLDVRQLRRRGFVGRIRLASIAFGRSPR
jgi:hypothetical protein